MRVLSLAAVLATADAFALGPRAPTSAGRLGSAVTMQVAAPAMVEGELKSITLSNSAGDSAKIYTYGACIASYVKAGTDVLMVRPDAKMDGSKPISGGIPFCFPQFGPGAIQQHGFARNLEWDVVEKTADSIELRLTENEYTLGMWPHAFEATYKVCLTANCLSTEFTVTNTGDKPFDFTAALHSYWSTSAISNIKISSPAFAGASYLDKTTSPPSQLESASSDIQISKEVDSVYAGVSGDVLLVDSERKRPLTISNKLGWSDTVVWNPYGDENMGYDGFVCVESAQASSPVVLSPQEYWTGAMDVVP